MIITEEKTANIQVLTSLPNSNKKHIDYVLFYELPNTADDSSLLSSPNFIKAEQRREQFFTQLKRESFEIYNLEQTRISDGKRQIISLLHCPVKRLMREAELLRIEMKLKNV